MVPVPAVATSGDVVVTVAGQPSNHQPFTVIVPPASVSVTPANAQGHTQFFTFTWSDPVAQSDLSQFLVKFSASASDGANSCWLRMDRNNIYFYDDAGHEVAGVPFGASTLLQNHQCGVHAWESTLTPAAAGGATANAPSPHLSHSNISPRPR